MSEYEVSPEELEAFREEIGEAIDSTIFVLTSDKMKARLKSILFL